jgi:hypothetical protein
MFGLPKETKLDFLVGCELQQIAFSHVQLILHFSRSASLSVESRLELKVTSDSAPLVWESNRLSELAGFATIIGASVVSYEIPGDGRLILRFSNGSVLTAYDSNTGYESYQVTGGGKTLVV